MRFTSVAAAVVTIASLFAFSAEAQQKTPEAEFLFIGSYHMGNPGLDLVNTKADDVLGEKRQREIAEVVRLLDRYRPTKVMLEIDLDRQAEISEKFSSSCKGKRPLDKSEREQLGFRVACDMGLKTVYAVNLDALTPVKDPDSIDYLKAVERHHQQAQYAELLADLGVWNAEDQQVLNDGTVLDMLKHINSDAWLHRNAMSYYEIGRLGSPSDPVGASWVQYWFGRNLAIFNTIARNTDKGDRVLVIYGSGHSNLLRQFATDSGLYKIHQPLDWLSSAEH